MAVGLDLWKWENGGYPEWFKRRVVAFYGLHLLVEAHRQEASEIARKKPE